MSLPQNLTILPGVRSDHLGRPYQLACYPSGKIVSVPYSEHNDTPPARTIPLPKEPEPVRPPKVLREIGTGKPMTFIPKRLMVLEFRERITQQRHKLEMPNDLGQQYVDESLRPLMRWDGNRWHAIEAPAADWFVQSHIDGKEPTNAQSE